ncbi:MAG: hypothetical protein MEP57_05410 [Microvirga sp.]|nr:hypothetical protein [Microvirga sp.]
MAAMVFMGSVFRILPQAASRRAGSVSEFGDYGAPGAGHALACVECVMILEFSN